jgi:hypothetical protein
MFGNANLIFDITCYQSFKAVFHLVIRTPELTGNGTR